MPPKVTIQSCFFYPCSFIKQTVIHTYTSSLLICHLFDSSIPWELWKRRRKVLRNMSWQEFGDLESRVLPLPKGCNSAHVTDILQAMSSPGYLRDPGSQPANPGWRGGSNSEEQVDGEAGSMAVEQIDNHIHGSMVETNRLWAWALQRPIARKE